MQAQSGCKMTIRGKGSVKLKHGESESELCKQPQHSHLSEPLHVVVEWEGSNYEKDAAFAKADNLLREMCVPPDSEEGDRIKRQQLRELAIINGTYKEDHHQYPNHQHNHRAHPQQTYQNSYNSAPAFASGVDPLTSAAFQQGFVLAQQAAAAQLGMGGGASQQYNPSMQQQHALSLQQPDATYTQYYGQY